MEKYLLFFERYHRGAVNVLLHDLGFSLWGLGIGIHNCLLILISPLIWESGHLYNYIKGLHQENVKNTLFPQLITWIAFALLGFILVFVFHL